MECKHVPIYRQPKGRKEIFLAPHPVPSSSYSGVSPYAGFPPFPSPNGLFSFFRSKIWGKGDDAMASGMAWAIPPFFLSQGVLSSLSFFLYVFLWETIFVRHPSVSPTQSRDVFLLTSGAEGMAQEKRGKWRYVWLCPFYMHFSGTFTLFSKCPPPGVFPHKNT